MTETDNLKKIGILSLAHFTIDLYSPVIPMVLPLLIATYGWPYFMAGLAVSMFNIVSSLSQPLIGYLSDVKQIIVPVSFTLLISGICIPATGLVSQYWMVLSLIGCAGLAHAFFHPVGFGMANRFARGPNIGRLTSYFVIGGNLGFALGGLIAGLCVGELGLPGLMLMSIPAVCVAVLLWFVFPVQKRDKTASDQKSCPKEPLPRKIKIGMGLLVSAAALRAWVIFGMVAFLPTFMTLQGYTIIEAGMILSGMLMAGVVGQVVGGTLSDRYGRKEYTLFGVVTAIPFFVLMMTSDGILFLVSLMAFGFLLWSTFSVTVTMSQEMMPKTVCTAAALMLGLALGVGGLGVALIGYLADATSLRYALSLLFIPLVCSLVLFAIVPFPWKWFGMKKRNAMPPRET